MIENHLGKLQNIINELQATKPIENLVVFRMKVIEWCDGCVRELEHIDVALHDAQGFVDVYRVEQLKFIRAMLGRGQKRL